MKNTDRILHSIGHHLGQQAREFATERGTDVEYACTLAAETVRAHLSALNTDRKMPPEAIETAVAKALNSIREGAGLGRH